MTESNGFSRNAHLYASSSAHLETGDLELALHALGDPEGLALLDVATGTGHTAFFFAERQAHVFAVDINDEMLAVAQEAAEQKSYSCRFLKGFAHDLPFDDAMFDIVSTRLAAHHFESPSDFMAEARRVLRRGGQIMVIDNVIPDGEAGAWINEFERQRDPSHVACLTVAEWHRLFEHHRFKQPLVEGFPKIIDYDQWMRRMSVEASEADALWETLCRAPEAVRDYLQPEMAQDKSRRLTLHRLVAVARRT